VAAAQISRATARRYAITHSLFAPATLQGAIDRLGFVQADPIRAPARAQDLILRHRVEGYRAGDLERQYASLDVEEDYLYAYGFVARRVWNLLHPRAQARMGTFEARVLEIVRASGEVHPADLEAHLGRTRVVNAWGGYSKKTTQALEQLHHRGLVRIARRERGVRVYKPAARPADGAAAHERLRALVTNLASIFAPSSLRSLQARAARFSSLGRPPRVIRDLIQSGELRSASVDGIPHVWPAEMATLDEVPDMVRFLAPFDPIVWDRARFESFWGWPYRFEAYTPVSERVRGYYAMPMLWRDRFIGWVNLGTKSLNVELGFVKGRPRDRGFSRELEAEIARMEWFLSHEDSKADGHVDCKPAAGI
jgi:uncharacterized protein YcaQ